MAEETKENKQGAQTNELGELFVKFGSEGLGGLVKGLNTVAGTFLLGKNAAEQFTKPLIDMSKKAAGTVANFDKISTVTGLTVQELQRLEIFSKQNSVDFNDTITNISKLQQSVLGLKNGLQTEGVFGLNLLGFNPQDLDYKKPIQAYEKIMARIVQLQKNNPAVSAQAAGLLGISDEQIYLYSQGNRLIDERLILSEKETKELRGQQQAWNNISVTAEGALNKAIARATWLIPLLRKISDLIADAGKNFEKYGFWQGVGIWENEHIWSHVPGAKLSTKIMDDASWKKARSEGQQMLLNSEVLDPKTGKMVKITKAQREFIDNRTRKINEEFDAERKRYNSPMARSPQREQQKQVSLSPINSTSDNSTAPPNLPPLPSPADENVIKNLTNSSNDTYNITMNVTTSDPREAANNTLDGLSSITDTDLNTAQYRFTTLN